ncbi:hypothetical protein RFI_15295, partial [Reticulomyxa filosa]
ELENHILHVVAYNSEDVLFSEGFLEASFEVIIRLAAAPFFRVKEEDLWQRTQEWAQCFAVPYLRRFRYKEKEQPHSSADEEFPHDRSEYETNLDRFRPYYTDPDHKSDNEEEEEEEEKEEEKPKVGCCTCAKVFFFFVPLFFFLKKKLSVQSKDFEPTQKTIDELTGLWDRWFVRVFRFALMKPTFFLDRVKDHIEDRDLREEVLVYFIDNKRRPKLSRFDAREMTQETGKWTKKKKGGGAYPHTIYFVVVWWFTTGCRVIKSNVEQDNAKTLFDLTKGSRWSYRTCQQMPDQHFIVELAFFSYPQIIKLKNHFDDIDCVKELKLFAWKNLLLLIQMPKKKTKKKVGSNALLLLANKPRNGRSSKPAWEFKTQVDGTKSKLSLLMEDILVSKAYNLELHALLHKS